jgi:hypothetical protein
MFNTSETELELGVEEAAGYLPDVFAMSVWKDPEII